MKSIHAPLFHAFRDSRKAKKINGTLRKKSSHDDIKKFRGLFHLGIEYRMPLSNDCKQTIQPQSVLPLPILELSSNPR